MRNEAGFTLIELVVVIVILGILAAVAVPRFVNLQDEARAAAVEGVAGGLASAVSINYAAELAGRTDAISTTGGCTAAIAAALLQTGPTFGAAPNEYSISLNGTGYPASPNLGDVITCTVTDNADTNATADFPMIFVN